MYHVRNARRNTHYTLLAGTIIVGQGMLGSIDMCMHGRKLGGQIVAWVFNKVYTVCLVQYSIHTLGYPGTKPVFLVEGCILWGTRELFVLPEYLPY